VHALQRSICICESGSICNALVQLCRRPAAVQRAGRAGAAEAAARLLRLKGCTLYEQQLGYRLLQQLIVFPENVARVAAAGILRADMPFIENTPPGDDDNEDEDVASSFASMGAVAFVRTRRRPRRLPLRRCWKRRRRLRLAAPRSSHARAKRRAAMRTRLHQPRQARRSAARPRRRTRAASTRLRSRPPTRSGAGAAQPPRRRAGWAARPPHRRRPLSRCAPPPLLASMQPLRMWPRT
jgi:hypothetical protein